MPFKCPTSVISTAIQVTRQTVVNAREALSERKLITYSKGTGKGSYPMYSLVLADSLTDNTTEGLPDSLPGPLQDSKTEELSGSLTPYNIEDRNIKDKNYSSNNISDVKILNLEELERLLVNDEPWLNEILFLLSPSCQIDLPNLKTYLGNFFRHLNCQGYKEREEKDCRRHFVNWIKKQRTINKDKTTNQPTTYATNQSSNDARRLSGVTAKSATDYEGAF